MNSSYNQIWMSIDNADGTKKEGFQVPYNPEDYRLTEGTNEKSVSIAGLGTIVVKNGKSPLTLSFSSFFPLEWDESSEVEEGDYLGAREYDAILRRWKNGTDPVHLLITNTNINAFFSVSTYTTEEEGGDVGKIQYSISLKQYGSALGTDENGGSGGTLVRKIDQDPYKLPEVPQVYHVQKKDTLQTIAKHFYGDISMAYEIYKLNTKLLKKGVNTKLKKKWVLNMPRPKGSTS